MEFELKKASKIYNRFTSSEVVALREANLKISGNDFISVMGVSGSGKSTMLHILGCLDEPTEGGYYINGENVINLDKNKLRNETIGFILQISVCFSINPFMKMWRIRFFWEQKLNIVT